MKLTLLATLLTAASASYAAAPTASLNHDPATYRNVTQKVAADYKAATAQCASLNGNAKEVCVEEAKASRAHAEADAVAQYNNTAQGQLKARTTVANADYALAKAKCGAFNGADKDSCLNTAHAAHTAALADAKAGRATATTSVAADGGATVASPVAATTTREATKAAAVDKCAQIAGQPNTGCLIDNKTANRATTPSGATVIAPGAMASRTETTAETAAEKTRNAAANAAEKTREMAATAAAKTERATDNMGQKTEVAAEKTGAVVADSVITTKVKADLFKEPELKSLGIHVETEKGVVMLSGFVDSKANAEKAVKLAKSVDGVQAVKSAIKVK